MALESTENRSETSADASITWNASKKLAVLALVLVAIGAGAMAYDLKITNALYSDGERSIHIPGDLRRVITLSEIFGHGSGLALIGATVLVLDPSGRRRAWRFFAISVGGGMTAALLKGICERTRPNNADLSGSVWETFGGWFPGAAADYAGQSIPSGHAAQAAALAIALAWLYPRGRWLFAIFATLACLQRVVSGAHFTSDVCLGAAVGCVAGAAILHPDLLGKWFDRWESKPPKSLEGEAS